MADSMHAQRSSERDRASAVLMIYASFAEASGGSDVGLRLSWQGVHGLIGVQLKVRLRLGLGLSLAQDGPKLGGRVGWVGIGLDGELGELLAVC